MTEFTPEQKQQMQDLGGSVSLEWNLSLTAATIAAGYSTADQKPNSEPRNRITLNSTAATIAALAALAPADEVEGAIAAQVVAFNSATLEALRRAAHPRGESVDTMWARAAELGRAMLDSLAALERRQTARRLSTIENPGMPANATAPVAENQRPPAHSNMEHAA